MKYLINLLYLTVLWIMCLILNKIIKKSIDKKIINLRKREQVLVLNFLRREKYVNGRR